jgi:hypothetical protein
MNNKYHKACHDNIDDLFHGKWFPGKYFLNFLMFV